MDIKIWNDLVDAIGAKKLRPWDIKEPKEEHWRKFQEIELPRYSRKSLEELNALIEPHADAKVKGAKTCLADLKLWFGALDGKEPKARNCESFEALLRQSMFIAAKRNLDEGRPFGPRIYWRDHAGGSQRARGDRGV